ncbi:uncharacterized protein A1O5_08602 [Cladophialophora psammophila CBS 110553]|uniref:Major facilitator superfamily (MFS) profile domain-containing protein n=1 Tax=Cladophialophora psammophila CBS 110553 TaxID=1182543 RepID=W9WJA3_9EURO|nr:uncharacterized protein A1O5_08602 [Cladophialophora psammophila CBS 110553]EXJ67988.1 hypothetical protein A1O5_08602 [Cladophialophora psammophila CBS 110553]
MAAEFEHKHGNQDDAVTRSSALKMDELRTAPTHLERVDPAEANLVYDDAEHEPELHLRTWIALVAMFLLNYVIVFALLSPPAVLSYIGTSLHNTRSETWVVNSLSLPQAVLSPLLSSVSDVFQVRKSLLVSTLTISFIGAGVCPGSQTMYRLIGGHIMIAIGFSCTPLAYAIPSEILPRRWRPIGQVWVNIAAALATCTGPLIIGALTKANPEKGWRRFYWIQMALWGAAGLGILAGYRPPKRHTRLDHLSFAQKLTYLDLPGFGLLGGGLTLFLVGLNMGGGMYAWTDARVLATLVVGIVSLCCFGIYEWKGTKTGILRHDLFRGGSGAGRTFAVCVGLIFAEGILLFSYVIFYPIMVQSLFDQDPFIVVVREQPYWIACLLSTGIWGIISTKFKTVKAPLAAGFVIFTGGIVGLATVQPSESTNSLIFAGLAGVGFGSLIILIVAGVQLSSPHYLIATATAVTVSSRAVAASIFTAIYVAAFSGRLKEKLPAYVAKAAFQAGLPQTSIEAFVKALVAGNVSLLPKIPGVSPGVVDAGLAALKQAYADSIRVVYIIAAPFGILAFIGCWFLGDLSATMNYRVDAPVEVLTVKKHDSDKVSA